MQINPDMCEVCYACVANCPSEAIQVVTSWDELEINQEKCTNCGTCKDICPIGAIQEA